MTLMSILSLTKKSNVFIRTLVSAGILEAIGRMSSMLFMSKGKIVFYIMFIPHRCMD